MIDLINELKSNHIQVSLNQDDIELSFDQSDIDNELLDKVKKNKKKLIEFLKKYPKVSKRANIPKLEIKENYPVSHAQQRMWVLSKLAGGSTIYHMPISVHLGGKYDIDLFKKAIGCVIDRHEILRTVFKEDQRGELRQWIFPPSEFEFVVNEIDYRFDSKSQELILAYIENDSNCVFNLEKGPLIRAYLFRKANDEVIFYYNMHHIISDGWSLKVLVKDIKEYYQALVEDREPNLQELRIQYKDYSVWQNTMLVEHGYDTDKKYWLNHLSGELPRLDLPSSKLPPPLLTHNGRHLETVIPSKIINGLRVYSREQGGSLFMCLLATWNVLFYKYISQRDIIIGTLVAGREQWELEDQIGYYVNTLALRNSIDPQDSFTKFFERVKESTLSAFSHQMYPFDKLAEERGVSRDLSRNPIVDVVLTLHNIKDRRQRENISSLQEESKVKDLGATHSKFYLEIDFWEKGDDLLFDLKFNIDVYEKETLENLMNHYVHLLSEILANPKEKIARLNILPEYEKNKLLFGFNHTDALYPAENTIIDLFEAQVKKTPNDLAIIYKENRLTFAEVNQLANKFALVLSNKLKVGNGDRIVVSLNHDQYLMAILLAVKKLGAIYVPVDPETPRERIKSIKEDSQSVEIIDNEFLKKILDESSHIEMTFDDWKRNARSQIEFIIYTSGSTGMPKGVLIKSSGVYNRLSWMWKHYPFQSDEVCCAKTSIGFVDHIWEFFGPLLQGIPLVFYSKKEVLDIPVFLNSLHVEKVTRIVLVPSLLRAILNHSNQCKEKLGNLNLWISSGEVLNKSDVRKFYAIMRRSSARLLNIYGSTEVTADATYYDTYDDFNGYKSFKLFDFSIKKEIEELIFSNDTSSKIITNSFDDISKKDHLNTLDFDSNINTSAYLEFLNLEVVPNMVNVGSTSFVGHMTGPVPHIFRELSSLVTAYNQNQVKIETSGISTHIEKQVIGFFHKLVFKRNKTFYKKYLQSSDNALGIISNGGTMSNILVLSFALNRLLKAKDGFRGVTVEGLVPALKAYGYEKVVLLGSTWCHYSFSKALKVLGLGSESFVQLNFENRSKTTITEEIEFKINELKKERTLILGLVGIAGTTESGNIDPLLTLANIAKKHGIHYHVDAAFGGSFLMDDDLAKKFDGIQLADSVTICAHKQLYVPIGLSVCVFKDPNFVLTSENNSHYQARKGSADLGRFTVEGSRNFMSLVLHAAFRIFGKEGFAEVIRHNYLTGQFFAKLIDTSTEFELMYEPDLNIVLYRYVPMSMRIKKSFNDEELKSINEINSLIQLGQFNKGNSFVSKTEIKGKTNELGHIVLRAVFMNPYTSHVDLELMLEEQKSIAARIEKVPAVSSTFQLRKSVHIGKPIENVKVYILDESLSALPIGVVGEICISGNCVSAGYINSPIEFENKFAKNPFIKGEVLFKTGDLGRRMDDGNIEFVSRKDNQVKIRGHRVELEEVENALLKNVNVKEAIVVANADIESQEVELTAYITADGELNLTELRFFLKGMLPIYMLPSYVLRLEKLPLNTSGKVDKELLSEVEKVGFDSVSYIAPEGETECRLTTIWEEVLSMKNIGMNDDFFELGGHSLKATRLLNNYQREFNVKLELSDVFLNTTLKSHSVLIASTSKTEGWNIQRIDERENYLVSHAQKSIWISSQFDKGSTAYNMPFSTEINNEVDIKLLTKAITATVKRHEILRTVFKEDEKGALRQWVFSVEDLDFKVDIKDFSKDENRNDLINAYILEDSNMPFDLGNGPLLRVALLKSSKERQILYYNIHHIICDGESLNIIRRDIMAHYKAYKDKKALNLPKLHIQFKDYAAWQFEILKSSESQSHKRYWVDQLSGNLPMMDLPGQIARPRERTYDGHNLVTFISPEMTEALKQFCLEHKGSLFMGTLSVWYILFSKYLSETDIIIGTPVEGRMHADLKNQIGCYFNPIAVRLQIDPYDSFIEVFRNVKMSVLNSYKHGAYPFDKIVEHLRLNRDVSRNPVFNIMFSYHQTNKNEKVLNIKDYNKIRERGNVRSKLDILIKFAEQGNSLFFSVDYNIRIYGKPLMKGIMNDYKELLRELLQCPNKKIRNLDYQYQKVEAQNIRKANLQKLKSY